MRRIVVSADVVTLVHRLARVLFQVRAREADLDLAARRRHDRDLAALHHRDLVLADLVALGQVGIEVILAREHARRLIVAPTASPKRIARSTAPLFNTGSTPGKAMSTAEACEFGAAPYAVAAPEKIFDAVDSCVCVSNPTTTSHDPVPSRLKRLGCTGVPVGHLLILVRDVQQLRFAEIVALQLHPDGQSATVEAAGYRQRRCTGEVGGDRENVVEVHLHRVVGLGAQLEGRTGAVGPRITSQCS